MKQVSSFLTLNVKDFTKGMIIAILTAVMVGVTTSINSGALPADWAAWKPICLSAIGAAVAYITKNWLTNSNDQFLKKEQ